MNLNLEKIMNVFWSMIFGMMGAIIILFVHNKIYQKTIATVNIKEIYNEHIFETGTLNLSEKENKIKFSQFNEKINKTIDEISESEKVILMVTPAVISKVNDYTDLIKRKIKNE
jgi:hypothetical protein